MKAANDAKVARGWKIVTTMRGDEMLVVREWDPRTKLFQWVVLDWRENFREIPIAASNSEGIDPQFDIRAKQLIYAGGWVTGGIFSYDFKEARTRLLAQTENKVSIEEFWMSPDAKQIICLQARLNLAPVDVLLKSEGKTSAGFCDQYALASWTPGDSHVRRLHEFSSPAFEADMDWRTGTFYVVLGKNLVAFDVEQKILKKITDFDQTHGVRVSPSGQLVVWSPWKHRIGVLKGASIEWITDSGGHPAFSNDGTMAYTINTNAICLMEERHEPREIIAFPFYEESIHDDPIWCPCGNHVAVFLTYSNNLQKKACSLVVLDKRAKEILLLRRPLEHSSERKAWVSGVTV